MDQEGEAPPPLDTRYEKTIRIAPRGDIRLTKLEVAIIDSRAFQRLRRIRQLGPSSWVYPTAVHTRFDHSIGVLQMVERMIVSIREVVDQVDPGARVGSAEPCSISERQRVLARLYALLHDVTHGPFGHTLEDELGVFRSHDAFQDAAPNKEDLARFEAFLGPESEIGALIIGHLGLPMYERFRDICFRGKTERLIVSENGEPTADEFIYYLVSDTVCADLLDYVERDSFFCDLGLRSPTRVLNYLYVADIPVKSGDKTEERRRVIIRLWKPRKNTARRDIMTDLAALLDARYMLAERVYFHPAKIIVGTMIGRAALEAKLSGHLNLQTYWWIGDDALLDLLASARPSGKSKDAPGIELGARLATDVIERRLYRCHHRYYEDSFSTGRHHEGPRDKLIRNCKPAMQRRTIENEIGDMAGVRAGDVLIYVGKKGMNLKVAEAIVDWDGGYPKLSEMDGEDTLKMRLEATRKAHHQLWSADLLVNPDLDETQCENVKNAFELRFLAHDDAIKAAQLLLLARVAPDKRFENRTRSDVDAACRRAAPDIVDRQLAAHSGNITDLMFEAVQKHLAA